MKFVQLDIIHHLQGHLSALYVHQLMLIASNVLLTIYALYVPLVGLEVLALLVQSDILGLTVTVVLLNTIHHLQGHLFALFAHQLM